MDKRDRKIQLRERDEEEALKIQGDYSIEILKSVSIVQVEFQTE